MAGTVTVTPSPRTSKNGREIEVYSVAWTSDASGNATGALNDVYGFLIKLVTDPDGTAAPTDNYDVTLVDEFGADALQGAGADRDTATTESVYPTPSGSTVPPLLCGDHTFTVAGAGNAKSGVAVFYILESL